MKGYQNSNILYVFDATPGEIPYVANNVTIIYVQQEQLAAWKTANSSYASLMQPYNYKMLVVKKLVWADHIDDDITYPTHNITVSSGADYITVASTAQYTSTVTITPKAGYTTANVNVAVGDVQVTAGAESWTFTMPDADVTVAASIDTHTITLTGDTTYVSAPATSYAGQTVTITPADLSNFNDITLTADGIEITKNDGDWTFTMQDANVSVAVAYVAPAASGSLSVAYDGTNSTSQISFSVTNFNTSYSFDPTSDEVYFGEEGEDMDFTLGALVVVGTVTNTNNYTLSMQETATSGTYDLTIKDSNNTTVLAAVVTNEGGGAYSYSENGITVYTSTLNETFTIVNL